MGLGGFLGSISPAFGLASGKGMFGGPGGPMAFGGLGLLMRLLGGHGAEHPQADLPAPQPLASLPGPGIGQTASALPQLPKPNIGQQVGSAFGAPPPADPGVSLVDPSFGAIPRNSGLGQLLAQILGS
jgi:hypothetical protein